MSLTTQDMEAIARLVDDRIRKATAPLEQRQAKVSGEYRELAPVARSARESAHDLEDRAMGFERMMMGVVGRIEEKVDAVVLSIPPAAVASKGAEAAAVAGALASVRVEGKTDAVALAANRADTHSLAASVGAHRALIAQIITAIALAAWQLYEHVHAGSP